MSCVKKNCDIIITGSQSSVLPYDIGNLKMFPLKQYSFLMGTQPDAVILCVNPFDDDDYIFRTINFLEASVNCKVMRCVCFLWIKRMIGLVYMVKKQYYPGKI